MNELSMINELQSYNIQEGQRVKALYLGEYPIQGEVISKRTKYGWKVQYGIKIEENLVLPFKSSVYQKGIVIAVDNTNIVEIL